LAEVRQISTDRKLFAICLWIVDCFFPKIFAQCVSS